MVGVEFFELLAKFFYFKYANSPFSQGLSMVGDALIQPFRQRITLSCSFYDYSKTMISIVLLPKGSQDYSKTILAFVLPNGVYDYSKTNIVVVLLPSHVVSKTTLRQSGSLSYRTLIVTTLRQT